MTQEAYDLAGDDAGFSGGLGGTGGRVEAVDPTVPVPDMTDPWA